MKLGLLFTLNAVIAAAFGLGFVVVPAQLLETYGVTLTPGTTVVARLFGAALVGYGILTWQTRAVPASDALRAIVVALFVGDVLGCLLALQGMLTGAINALGWSTVVIYGLLAAGFGYFAFGKAAAPAKA